MNGKDNSGSTLLRIVEKRRETVEHRKRVLPLAALKFAVEKKAPPVRDFAVAITANRLNVIAELKKQSPSRGVIRDEFVPAKLASELADAGAAALSVLTEEDFFAGSLAYLKDARASADVPVLRKDFLFDPWQVWEARAAGADSILLIVAILEPELLSELMELGRQLGMEPLVEIHTRAELIQARDAGARIIGVNARDLATFDVSLERAFELAGEVPDECVAVAESGIRTHEDLARLSQAGFDAFLIGEQLMKSAHPGDELRRLLAMSESKTARL